MLYEYLKKCSLKLVIVFFLLTLLFHGFGIMAGFWLSDWADSNIGAKNRSSTANMTDASRLTIFAAIGSVQRNIYQLIRIPNKTVFKTILNAIELLSLAVEMLSVLLIINSSRNFHSSMLNSILRTGTRFFESTPVGRILNRFSKDMCSIESAIPVSFKDLVYCSTDGVATAIVIVLTTPMALTVLVPIAALYFIIQRFYVASGSKLKRLDGTSKSPVFAHFSETLNGLSTIKAYRAEQRFTDMLHLRVDDNSRFIYPNYVADRFVYISHQIIT